ncbi:MAG: Ig-like domain-containing protein [Gammaproteobacteria bacterium]|nr:Ig-like domain-containing protein [Gammaproteobacteria bacterium]MDE0257301.1 Ig-like domain-containing protein [Gammaproteobacteria bacterium]
MLAICAIAVWGSSGCGDDATRPPPDTLRVASVTVTPAAASLTTPDQTVQLNALVRDGNGRAMSGVAVIWTSVRPEVARVGASGLVAAAGNGTTTIAATVGAVAGTATVTVAVEHGDRAALAALHAATDGPNWADDENWLGDGPLGEWRGVETDAFGRIVRLDLGGRQDGETGEWVSHGLRGPLPPELGSLTGLTSLNLRANALAGPIPPQLGNLARLEELWLDGNQLEGPIPPELGRLAGLMSLSLSGNALDGPVPPELGALADLEGLWLDANRLEGPIPPELGRLAHLRGLSLSGNALDGPVPVELGGLRRLEFLHLDGNALTGALPRSLVRIDGLVRFRFERNDGLCAPGTAEFMAWLDGIGELGRGPFCNETDRAALAALHAAAGGENWTDSEGWLGGVALAGWHGVETDSLGRVATLDLAGNGLAGRLPAGLGDLAAMTALRVGDNALSGRLPRTLLDLPLGELDYSGTELCAPADETFRTWLGAIALLWGTGTECASATDREILEMLHDATGGRDWIDARNWLTDAPLGEWRGVEVDDQGSVIELRLWDNGLVGRLPPELGALVHLEYLRLSDNGLTGAIPPELGGLSGLTHLVLDGNALSGPIPPELGGLPALEELRVENNDLSGPLSPELGGLASLRGLGLTGNPRLSGPLPVELTSLGRLERLLTGGTGLCAPADPAFAAWLDRVHTRRVVPCAEREAPAAYLVQAVQSRAFPVPLVAGARALLRVFPTAARAAGAGVPAVRARFFVDGRETHVEDVPGKSGAIPARVDEGSLATSVGAEIPGSVVQPGLEMVVEVDPDGTLDPALGVARRIPATGRLAVDVRALPPLELTVVPFLWAQAPDSSILDAVRGMAADPEGHALLADARALLPLRALDVTAHEPVLSSSNDARRLLEETEAIRALEGGGGHYLGTMAGPVTGPSGTAFLPGRAGFSIPRPGTVAHELGHNLGLRHAPCGGAGDPDPSFPHPDGSAGAWGYDFARGALVRPTTPDLMSYCGPPDGISDYHFANALRYRLFEARESAAPAAVSATSLLMWGGADPDGAPFLNPAFIVEAPPALPDSAGAYTLTGRTAGGTELFSIRFAMPRAADGDGGSGFAFVLPAEPGWAGELAGITLAGPGGTFALNDDSDLPTAILRDPRTGRVRGILRQVPPSGRVAMDAAERSAAEPEFEVLFSRGMPDAAAWWR